MLIDTHDAVKKLMATEMKMEQAEAITSIISGIDDKIATKADIKMLESKIDLQTTWLTRSAFAIIGLLIKIAFF